MNAKVQIDPNRVVPIFRNCRWVCLITPPPSYPLDGKSFCPKKFSGNCGLQKMDKKRSKIGLFLADSFFAELGGTTRPLNWTSFCPKKLSGIGGVVFCRFPIKVTKRKVFKPYVDPSHAPPYPHCLLLIAIPLAGLFAPSLRNDNIQGVP